MAWFGPAVKAILPYVGSIVAAALPVFTKRKSSEAAAQAQLLQQQIDELQTAASRNAVHIKELAEQLQKTVSALEQGSLLVEPKIRSIVALCVGTIMLSCIALGVSLFVLFGR